MTTCVALLRGINVGKAKRIPMADLRKLVEGLGHNDVRTLLNSGNIVFDAPRPSTRKLAESLSSAIEAKFGFEVPVLVVTARELETVVGENTMAQCEVNPSRFLVGFVSRPAVLDAARPLLEESWGTDELRVGSRAAYLWCAEGVLASSLFKAFSRALADDTTTRNWATVLKLQALANPSG